jgi:biopolymer transport protein TolQ
MENEVLKVTADFSAWHAISSASPIVKITFIILVGMSIFSWMIIFAKYKTFKSLFQENERFLNAFWKAETMDEMVDSQKDYEGSNLCKIFIVGFQEIKKIRGANKETMLSKAEILERSLNNSVESEILDAERGLSFLATTGSTAPFIGLFGTVWGIMGSFQKIGLMKSASLAVVAPGISEALIATAVGLAAAIPASIAYNHYVSKIKKLEHSLNSYAGDLVNVAERNFF